MELEKKFEDLGKAFEAFKKANDTKLEALEKKGSVDALVTEQVEKANKHIETLTAEIKEMQTAMNRSAAGGGDGGKGEEPKNKEQKEAFHKYMRKGMIVEQKGLSAESDPSGGYLIPDELSATIVQKIFESSPMRALADVETISGSSLEVNEDLGEIESGWVGESETREETDTPTVGLIEIPAHELYAMPKATQKVLDDAAWNLEAWLGKKCADKFSRDEASAFINGTGVKKPRGILTYTAGTGAGQIEQVNSGGASTLTADGLISVHGALKGFYRAGATWLMKRSTITAARKLKGSDNNYLWQPGLSAGTPDSLLGSAVHEADDFAAIGADVLAGAYGNFKYAYKIVDRVGIRVLRDPLTQKGFVLFYTTKRVGGGVVNFEALKILKIAA